MGNEPSLEDVLSWDADHCWRSDSFILLPGFGPGHGPGFCCQPATYLDLNHSPSHGRRNPGDYPSVNLIGTSRKGDSGSHGNTYAEHSRDACISQPQRRFHQQLLLRNCQMLLLLSPKMVGSMTSGPVAVTTVEPLAFGAGMPPTRLLIPALNLDTPVETMGWKVVEDAKGLRSEWEVVDFAAGHHINSAFPGEAGNVVLSGHNNIGGSVFKSVCVIGQPGVDFGLGDEMILEDEMGRRFAYQVNGWRRMQEANASIAQRQDNAQYLNPTTDAQLTLVTCWPPNSNTHRVVVTGLLAGIE